MSSGVLSIGTRLRPTAQHRTSRICWLKHPIRVLLLLANDLRFGANNLRFGARRENRPLDRQALRSLAG
jgi:hypothetical protein